MLSQKVQEYIINRLRKEHIITNLKTNSSYHLWLNGRIHITQIDVVNNQWCFYIDIQTYTIEGKRCSHRSYYEEWMIHQFFLRIYTHYSIAEMKIYINEYPSIYYLFIKGKREEGKFPYKEILIRI